MISSLKRLMIGTAAVIGFAASANASYVTDSWTDHVAGTALVTPGNSYTYVHDIKPDGFDPLSDVVENFSISIDLFDDYDQKTWWGGEEGELAQISSGWISVWAGMGEQTYNLDLTDWLTSLLITTELNDYGTLTVKISSILGDFYFGGSTLVANGYSQVPEPGTIALLGLGLLGIGLGRRKAAK